MNRNITQTVLSAILLFCTIAIQAAEEQKDAWFQRRSLTERTANWTNSSSLRATQDDEDTTPPGEPDWGSSPVGEGICCLFVLAGGYALYKKQK